ncbi:related to Peroxisomal membrane protein PMP47A [Saccharomycodes ludwigii]|uniref:Related to Peroxisomal membrane protein PMP47A n=1 Tax=Saccharomycodes ludwigii TaxID=36035 RepID=A0A376B5J9_9ASCO|nr:hypothetical protein SCDLUD_003236 [Saccharomycodes ludwigii]KAH3900264.1 hypothetical protein SCDLUD_003236 [Saccharomycodes ludwigii]SSD59965.1 related to Peroxisomal membrane protein PMP47A [Saccharomycodes ludwigii]
MTDSVLVHALAGATGGAASIALTYPLVTLTTNLQKRSEQRKNKSPDTTSDKNSSTKKSKNTITIKEKEQPKYEKKTTFEILKQMIKNKTAYNGLESCICGITLTNFVYYYFYEYCIQTILKSKVSKAALTSDRGKKQTLNTLESMVAGLIAGTITAVVANPFWLANTRMTTNLNSRNSRNTLQTIVGIVQHEGIGAIFKGLKPALVLVINPVIQYTVFEQLKNIVAKDDNVISPFMAFLLGALGKLAATGATYPYITLKTRMHLVKEKEQEGKEQEVKEQEGKDKRRNESTNDKRNDNSMFGMLIDIIKSEGLVNGLYRGICIKLTQSILTAAFLFFFKESFVRVILKLVKTTKKLRNS